MKNKIKEVKLSKAELKAMIKVPNLKDGLKGGIYYSNAPIKSLQQAAQQVKIERMEKEENDRANKKLS